MPIRVIMTKEGINLDDKFHEGVRLAMEMIEAKEVDLAILQSRSPTCGVKQIYECKLFHNDSHLQFAFKINFMT